MKDKEDTNEYIVVPDKYIDKIFSIKIMDIKVINI